MSNAMAVHALIDSMRARAPEAATSRVECASKSCTFVVVVLCGWLERINATMPETLAAASELPVAKS